MDSQIAAILQQTKTIAVIGASDNWKRPSFYVMKYLLSQGYQIIPVNPRLAGQTILGQTCFESLADIPQQIDMVDIFRPASDCPDIVEQAISIGAKTVWMQIGIVSEVAASRATEAGLDVIMDKCSKIEHTRLSGLLGLGGLRLDSYRLCVRPHRQCHLPNGTEGCFSRTTETLSIHAGARPDAATIGAFAFDNTDHAASLYDLQQPGNIYGRLSNPTTAVLEQRLASLDSGIGACCVGSGHAAPDGCALSFDEAAGKNYC